MLPDYLFYTPCLLLPFFFGHRSLTRTNALLEKNVPFYLTFRMLLHISSEVTVDIEVTTFGCATF